jgi:hypothetical protein
MTKKRPHKKVVKTVHETDGSTKTTIKETPVGYERKEHEVHPRRKHSGEKRMTSKEREDLLIENFVGIQHAMTNLSIKFGTLSDNISKLLMVFESAAKNVMEGTGNPEDNEDMLSKINSLLDQNKTIAKGLVLMEGKLRGRHEVLEDHYGGQEESASPRGYQESQVHSPMVPNSEHSRRRQPLPRI